MNKFFTTLIGAIAFFTIATGVFAANNQGNDLATGYSQMTHLTKQAQLQAARNSLLNEQLKSAKLYDELKKVKSGSHTTVNRGKVNNAISSDQQVNTDSQDNHDLAAPFSLIRITGSAQSPSAWVAFNGSTAQVKEGDILTQGWQVKTILSNHVVLTNTKTHAQRNLYMASVQPRQAQANTNQGFNE